MEQTKQIVIDKIYILERGEIHVRQATRFIEDGRIIAQSFQRHVFEPNYDATTDQAFSSYWTDSVQKIANTIWTQEVKDNYTAFLAAKENNGTTN